MREEVSVDMDSFDYGFYMYGLQHYGNMPLIEENEFREAKKIEELVIAIDTSASCKEKLVQQFLNETGAILKHQESFFHKVHIRIIECDNQFKKIFQSQIWTKSGNIPSSFPFPEGMERIFGRYFPM